MRWTPPQLLIHQSQTPAAKTNAPFNPFTPKCGQFQISPAGSPEISHNTVRRTWLFIAYSDKRWISYQFSLPHVCISNIKCWENVLIELGSERVKKESIAYSERRRQIVRRRPNERAGREACKERPAHPNFCLLSSSGPPPNPLLLTAIVSPPALVFPPSHVVSERKGGLTLLERSMKYTGMLIGHEWSYGLRSRTDNTWKQGGHTSSYCDKDPVIRTTHTSTYRDNDPVIRTTHINLLR